MTNSAFEVRYHDPSAFLLELQRDYNAGAIQDSIVRLTNPTRPARVGMVQPDRSHDGRAASSHWRAVFVECSYMSTRGQIVKLSHYCGVNNAHGDTRFHGNAPTDSAALGLLVEIRERLQAVAEGSPLDIRGGDLAQGDGDFQDTPDPMPPYAPGICATCHTPIYFANAQWRHAQDHAGRADYVVTQGRAEATTTPTRDDSAPGRFAMIPQSRLHHLADPKTEGRKV